MSAKKASKKAPRKAATERASGPAERVLMTEAQLKTSLRELAKQVRNAFPDLGNLLVLGIRTRGVPLADRLRAELEEQSGMPVTGGVLDITLYRDDLSTLGPQPMVRDSEIPHDVTGTDVLLVDDVIYTGRTVRAAMDEIVDFGRPNRIRLLVLVDRGWREYPIQPDFVGLSVETTHRQVVHVRLDGVDGADEVLLETREDAVEAQ